ncbi:MAG: hypothetical protein COX52_04880, partial [Syntrophobacterales bacterium CG23_combo_of_CG06-09_8_20_14_all_48_27]
IYRWVIGTSTSWKDLEAKPTLTQMGGTGTSKNDVFYYGIGLGKSDGTLYATYAYADSSGWYTGVARCLTPAVEVCCGALVWDYLHAGLTVKASSTSAQQFNLEVASLDICGCLDATTNSKLWAIDNDPYKMADGKDGTLWAYEDCVAKVAPKLTAVADKATVAADPCVCFADVFTLTWGRLCSACEYDIQVALDKGFKQIVKDTADFTTAMPSRKGP